MLNSHQPITSFQPKQNLFTKIPEHRMRHRFCALSIVFNKTICTRKTLRKKRRKKLGRYSDQKNWGLNFEALRNYEGINFSFFLGRIFFCAPKLHLLQWSICSSSFCFWVGLSLVSTHSARFSMHKIYALHLTSNKAKKMGFIQTHPT